MRLSRKLLLVIIAAVVALAPSAAFARVIYVCKMTGTVGTQCCCPASLKQATKSTKSDDTDRVRKQHRIEQDCCDALAERAADDGAVVNVDVPIGRAIATLAPAAVDLALPFATVLVNRRGARLSQGPPPHVPLFIKHCALLN